MKIMREMLKRRQFIFGKQNTNRHQPYVDDVVTSVYTQYNNASNVADEDDTPKDVVMKFAPTKKQVIDIVKYDAPEDIVFNISEEDVEFVDTFLYNQDNYDHIGYIYKLTNGSVTIDGQSTDISNSRIMCAGPVLALDGEVVFVTTREPGEEGLDYMESVVGASLKKLFYDSTISSIFTNGAWFIVDGFDPNNTGVSITQLPDPSYTVNITKDMLPYIADHLYWSAAFGPVIDPGHGPGPVIGPVIN